MSSRFGESMTSSRTEEKALSIYARQKRGDIGLQQRHKQVRTVGSGMTGGEDVSFQSHDRAQEQLISESLSCLNGRGWNCIQTNKVDNL